jgi:hypothetical protein
MEIPDADRLHALQKEHGGEAVTCDLVGDVTSGVVYPKLI